MKKNIAIVCAVLMLFLTACHNQTPPIDDPIQSEQSAGDGETNSINTMEKLLNIDGVVSVTKQTFSTQIRKAVAYKMLYESENGKIAADVVLPSDYADENRHYPVLIYFPDVNTYIDTLATNYALNNIIVVRPYVRGNDESEGVRDLAGNKDLADWRKLLQIMDSASFIEDSKVFVAGSAEGSIHALRLFAEDTDKRISGCAVVDVIADLPGFGDFRGEGIRNFLKTFIGKSYEEAPEEYDLRSAVKFPEKLDRPMLLLHYTQNPGFSVEQTDAFYELLSKTNKDCAYYKIDALLSDFHGEGMQRLLSWINKYD